MVLIALTGALHLIRDEISDAFHGDLRTVAVEAVARPASSPQVAAALAAHPGTLRAWQPPAAPDRSAQVQVTRETGERDVVQVNPHTGAVLGSDWDAGFSGSPLMRAVRKLHSLDHVGCWGNRIIEAVAGWAVLLTASGIHLWWPRGRAVGVFRLCRRTGRGVWRDLRAVTGINTAGVLLLLIVKGLGMPEGCRENDPVSTVPTGEALGRAPRILEHWPMPVSQAAEGVPAGLDAVAARVEALGIHSGHALAVPLGPEGVYTASVHPDDITHERVIHLDRYAGPVLFDMSLADLGALGRAAEWGISVHMGQEFGPANQLVLLAACLAFAAMAVPAAAMWWKRRPKGGPGAPPLPANGAAPRVVLGIALAAGVGFPLIGLSLMVVLAAELAVGAMARRRAA
ncbi:PepSY domain-containing protein [Paralimibaculum aggregatum]|uniref:PepSY domain-containing protein n=2 Tax=Paralimibaculum aggregatum TaxID=3036245 RepID=A0ABQ6LC82_9RHOB|nr:PepSY domain-containing protein [Limibaculum sp. NKW23]